MNRRERDDIQLILNSMGDVVNIGFARSVDPLKLVGTWRTQLAALLKQKTCIMCGADVLDGDYDLCPKCDVPL